MILKHIIMARQKGIVPFEGNLGGINFYYLNGKQVARKAGGGFNAKSIRSKATILRVRENASEFGHCSSVNKIFRQAIRPFYNGHTFTHLHSRLMGLFTKIKNFDTIHERGARTVSGGMIASESRKLLSDFAYTPSCDILRLLPFPMDYDAITYSLQISNINIASLTFPPGATHLEISFAVLELDFETLDYTLHQSEKAILSADVALTELSFTPQSFPAGSATLLPIAGLRSYQEINGDLLRLNSAESIGFSILS